MRQKNADAPTTPAARPPALPLSSPALPSSAPAAIPATIPSMLPATIPSMFPTDSPFRQLLPLRAVAHAIGGVVVDREVVVVGRAVRGIGHWRPADRPGREEAQEARRWRPG